MIKGYCCFVVVVDDVDVKLMSKALSSIILLVHIFLLKVEMHLRRQRLPFSTKWEKCILLHQKNIQGRTCALLLDNGV